MERLRTKLTYANVISTLALFLVVAGGTAIAAKQMLPKNSVGAKQLKKGAVTPSKLTAGAKSTLTGPQGPQGAQGIPGLKGDPGTPASAALKSGESESGFYAAGSGGGEEGFIAQGITFRQPLATKIPENNAEWLREGETSASCPGVGTAAPGHLCLYDNEESQIELCCIYDNEFNEPAADKNGFIIYWEPTGSGSYVSGEYTVTAP